MNTLIIISVVLFIGAGFGQRNLEKCPHINEVVQPLNMKQLYGVWYAMRIGPPCMEEPIGSPPSTPDCVQETYWSDNETEDGLINVVMKMKMNESIEFHRGLVNTTVDYSDRPELPANTFEFTLFGMKSPLTFLDSDAGRSWVIGYSCWEFGPKNVSASWFISSRFPYMDPKLEQSLVQRIQKIAPSVSSNELIAIGHIDCY